MPPVNRLAPPPANSFAEYGPYGPVTSDPAASAAYQQQLVSGLGSGLANQLRGMYQTVRHAATSRPIDDIRGALASLAALYDDPMQALQALREMRQRAMSGPQGLGQVLGELAPLPGPRGVPNAMKMASTGRSKFPRVDEIEWYPVGPTRIKPRVIAEGKPLYRETSAENLGDYLRYDSQFDAPGGFFTDDPELAIGQGTNKGVMVRFRPNSVSGQEHIKPGTGVIGGREYRADIVAPRAIEEVVLKNAKDWKRLGGLAQRNLANNFTRVVNKDGSVTFTRKTED